jgi:hypothetical protein
MIKPSDLTWNDVVRVPTKFSRSTTDRSLSISQREKNSCNTSNIIAEIA